MGGRRGTRRRATEAGFVIRPAGAEDGEAVARELTAYLAHLGLEVEGEGLDHDIARWQEDRRGCSPQGTLGASDGCRREGSRLRPSYSGGLETPRRSRTVGARSWVLTSASISRGANRGPRATRRPPCR